MRRPRPSVRDRIAIAVAALVTAALVGTGVAMWIVESRRIDQGIDDSIRTEMAEFRKIDGGDADDRLDTFLAQRVPAIGEVLWMFPTAGDPSYVGQPGSALLDSPEFARVVDRLRTEGAITDLSVDGRTHRVGVLPVIEGDRGAALVITRDRSAAHAALRDLMTTYALAAALALVIVVAVSRWLAGRLLRPVTRLRDTARAMSAGSLDERIEVTGHDDLTDLQVTFNAMLDRLEDAFRTQRETLDDAGHELRTPLTVLRGHLEVMDARDPEDVAGTRALLLDEIDRMSRLVDELLVLAKARRPDFVHRRATDLTALGDGIWARCVALADRDWRSAFEATGTADVDAQRVTQAVLQLADNAVRHTRSGTTITLGSTRSDTSVEFWVADTGPGVPQQDRDEIFERFTTGDGGAGSGLGLSIVRAIAVAHGGKVAVEDPRQGTGAVFRLRLPLEGVDA